MTSTIRGTPNGQFSKNSRFRSDNTTAQFTPGPQYEAYSTFKEHKQGPVYKQKNKAPAPSSVLELNKTLPHPTRDRTAWMIGTTEGDVLGFHDIAERNGPATYHPETTQTKPLNARAVFAKDPRFKSLTGQFISKEHNQANLCTGSPGPKYYSKTHNTDLTKGKTPHYSFRSKGIGHRDNFLNSRIEGDYIYQSKPGTNEKTATVSVDVSPSTYSPDSNVVKNKAPRPQWTKAERFEPSPFAGAHKQFISRKHTRVKAGMHAPGPQYAPSNFDMYQPNKRTQVTGKWCP